MQSDHTQRVTVRNEGRADGDGTVGEEGMGEIGGGRMLEDLWHSLLLVCEGVQEARDC